MEMPKYDPAQAQALADIMSAIPGAKASKMFGMPAYKVNGKLAVSLFDEWIVLKVGAARASELIANGEAQPFSPLQDRVWKEWVKVGGDPAPHEALFAESVAYVGTTS